MSHNGVIHNGGGRRNGSFAIYLEPWHADIQDFLEMKKTLEIQQENRPGPSGNPNDANAANFDENQVRDYTLPQLTTTQSGMPVNSVADWENRKRPQLIAAFEQEMYGALPDEIPAVS